MSKQVNPQKIPDRPRWMEQYPDPDPKPPCPRCGAYGEHARPWRTNGQPPRRYNSYMMKEYDEYDKDACVTCGAESRFARPENVKHKPVAASNSGAHKAAVASNNKTHKPEIKETLVPKKFPVWYTGDYEDREIFDNEGSCPSCGARRSNARSWRTNGKPPRHARHRGEDDEEDVNACVTCGAKATDARPKYVKNKPVAAASSQPDLTKLSEINVPSSANLVVSDLPKSNSGVAKTEQVMEQVMAANVSKGLLSRKKSLEVLASPAAQHYADLRVHLTQSEVIALDAAMIAVHGKVEVLLGQHLSQKDEKTALQALFDQYDLCKYVRTADKARLTIPELTAILTSFGQVDKRVRQATTRSTICYIILSIVLMDPKTFIEKLSGINKGAYAKK